MIQEIISYLTKTINYLTKTTNVNCLYCKKNINIKKKYANKYLCCSNECGFIIFTNLNSLNSLILEDNKNSDTESLL